MNKNEFIVAVAEKAGISKKDAAAVIDAYADVIKEALIKGDKVAITGFGSFEIKSKDARKGYNPSTGQAITIAASKTPVLKFGKAFKDEFSK